MKKLILILGALALTGCASNDYAQYSKAQTDIACVGAYLAANVLDKPKLDAP